MLRRCSSLLRVWVDPNAEIWYAVYITSSNWMSYVTDKWDAGLTEFAYTKTLTAVAVGPSTNEDVDNITGELKLL